ncbi:NADH-quinone oxidoreductase subunit J [Desulfosporosinus sp. OT]|uniref:NADH-quinone oxidoreductase subunit J family protein n=1 Tax=Desulfosporosinus sp. OT TaxID=913865 RepID=UPI000223A309|nr:NADH-quinone oxidoreductase subunit J [Desulfosporosinus sp. OT]EGW37905.1 NADH-ubiquinone/plastoquinone oxidoreductase chain 6 family protein [Desulfosporosinus sp. OT]
MVGTVVFFIFAIMAIAAAWGVVTSKNIVHSALYLVLSFLGVAVLYVLMNADFLAAVQLLIYTGAVAIMIVFAVMLTLRGEVSESNPENRHWGWGALVALLVFVVMALVILANPDWRILPAPWTGGGSAEDMSLLLLTKFMIPFEAAAVLLTVALAGAVILAKGVKESK